MLENRIDATGRFTGSAEMHPGKNGPDRYVLIDITIGV